MYCKDVQSCFKEINAYCSRTGIGRALLVNTENYDIFQEIRAKLEADSSKKCIYVSNACPDAGMPALDDIVCQLSCAGSYVLIGFSQAAMLRSGDFVEKEIGSLLELSVRGHVIILLEHCEKYLKKHFSAHPDIEKRIVLVSGVPSQMPRIYLAESTDECIGFSPLPTMKHLFAYLENLSNDKLRGQPEVTVTTSFTPALFEKALYSVSALDSIYERLRKKYPDVASGTEETYGTDAQWYFLAEKLKQYQTLSSLTDAMFGSTINLASHIGEVYEEDDSYRIWYLWLSMKIFGTKGNHYLTMVLRNSQTSLDLEEHVYLDILKIKHDASDFVGYYIERKRLLDAFPENLSMVDKFLDKAAIYGKNEVFYLTDRSEKEEFELMKCLSIYDYSEDELLNVTRKAFPELYQYLQPFEFNSINTKLPTSSTCLWDEFTVYFKWYKHQKLTNKISSEHMKKVEEYATSRPYNMVPPRTAIISKLDRSNAQLYFFDALGVEYLSYILQKCEQYDLIAEISVAHGVLPSITTENKDFIHYFPGGARDIKELDTLKHHSQVIDYEQCKLPIHLFRELEIIDSELRKIQSALKQAQFEKAVIVSDHGASRLAVIYEQENPKLELEEKGEHSGRCCPVPADPHITYASYENGYSVLANYERFKGGRKANVEVHGGAALEEVLIPIIVLTKKPADIDICFVDSLVKLKGKEPATIIVFSNIPLHEPRLFVNGIFYAGEFDGDSRHARFVMPELKRSKNWVADLYDGDKRLASAMEFRVQKGDTQEKDFFHSKKRTY